MRGWIMSPVVSDGDQSLFCQALGVRWNRPVRSRVSSAWPSRWFLTKRIWPTSAGDAAEAEPALAVATRSGQRKQVPAATRFCVSFSP